MTTDSFVDYYELLQISPNAEPETVQRVFRMLASRFHPDNPHTGDSKQFLSIKDAYEVLNDAERRAEYDLLYRAAKEAPMPIFELPDFVIGVDVETNKRNAVLCLLYKQRKMDHEQPGVSILELENVMGIAREHLMFTVWYLREKGCLKTNDNSELVITAAGIDFVESHLPSNRLMSRLLKAPEDPASHNGAAGPQAHLPMSA